MLILLQVHHGREVRLYRRAYGLREVIRRRLFGLGFFGFGGGRGKIGRAHV